MAPTLSSTSRAALGSVTSVICKEEQVSLQYLQQFSARNAERECDIQPWGPQRRTLIFGISLFIIGYFPLEK